MKRVLLALALSIPFAAFAEGAAKDLFVKGDAAAGATKAAVCGACHGPTGNSSAPIYPKLAGQSSKYIYEQLLAYKSGKRPNPIMAGQVANLSDQDMKDLAAHYASLKLTPGVANKDSLAIGNKLYRAGDAARGIPACASCHGPKGAGQPSVGYPRIGGQNAEYTLTTLQTLRGIPTESLPEGNVKMMATIAGKLSDKEIAALASYLNGLQ